MPSNNVTAVVVNWNRPEDTLACLESLRSQEAGPPDLVVVDNGSTDDSVARIRAAYPQATLIASPHNLRFGGGYNLGIRRALEDGAEYVLVINNDATLAPDALGRMLEHAAREDVGLVAPLIYYADDPGRVWSSGGDARPLVLEVTAGERDRLDPQNWPAVLDRDFVTGCCFLASRRTFEQVGLFDERFAMYYEDSDLSRRVRARGLRVLVIPTARAWHKVASSSGGQDTPDERYWMARSSVAFFRKHARGWQWVPIALYRLGSALKTSVRLLRQGKSDSLRAYWRGLWDGLTGADAPP